METTATIIQAKFVKVDFLAPDERDKALHRKEKIKRLLKDVELNVVRMWRK